MTLSFEKHSLLFVAVIHVNFFQIEINRLKEMGDNVRGTA